MKAQPELLKVQGEALRNARKKAGLSTLELTRLVRNNPTQGSLSNYETGKRELPLNAAITYAHALGIPLTDLAYPKENGR